MDEDELVRELFQLKVKRYLEEVGAVKSSKASSLIRLLMSKYGDEESFMFAVVLIAKAVVTSIDDVEKNYGDYNE